MIKDAIFYITGLNFTLVPNSEEHFLIFTSYYYWERKKYPESSSESHYILKLFSIRLITE